MTVLTSSSWTSFADRIPYATPNSLDDLHGPTEGVVKVDSNINTSPHPYYDLDDKGRVRSMYVAVLQDGSLEQQEALLDKATLLRVWPDLMLTERCRRIWEDKFSELSRQPASA